MLDHCGRVQAALIGSILANSLLVLGLAILTGGLKNGKQVFCFNPLKNDYHSYDPCAGRISHTYIKLFVSFAGGQTH